MTERRYSNTRELVGTQAAVRRCHFVVGRACCLTVVLALVVGAMPQCIAAHLSLYRRAGVYLTHDNRVIDALVGHALGNYWIDGYQMTVSKQTQICWHNVPLEFGSVLNRDGQPIPRLKATSPCDSTPSASSKGTAWLQYLANETDDQNAFRPSMKIIATRIDVWKSDSNGDLKSGEARFPRRSSQALCASASPTQLRYPNEGPIDVVCGANLSSYVEKVFPPC